MNVIRFVMCWVVGVFVSVCLAGTDYYVDFANGDDDNIGTDASPFKNVRYALGLAEDGDTIHLATGNHTMQHEVITADDLYILHVTNAVKIVGATDNPEDTKLVYSTFARIGGHATFLIDNPNAVVANLTVDLANADDGYRSAYVARITSGTMRNCVCLGRTKSTSSNCASVYVENADAVLDGCTVARTITYGNTGAVDVRDGLVKDTIVYGNEVRQGCAGIKLTGTGARVIGCTVRDNKSSAGDPTNTAGWPAEGGSGVYFVEAGGVVSNCTISGNAVLCAWRNGTTGNLSGGGVYFKKAGGTVYNSRIVNNSSYGPGGGVCGVGTLVNCLIAGNRSENDEYPSTKCSLPGEGGATYGGVKLINCTVYGNQSALGVGGIVGAASVTNCIVVANVSAELGQQSNVASTAKVGYTLSDTLIEGEGNKAGDPQFKDVSKGQYQLMPSSPASRGGIWLDMLSGCVRLDGAPMVGEKNGLAMGCFGLYPNNGLIIIFR